MIRLSHLAAALALLAAPVAAAPAAKTLFGAKDSPSGQSPASFGSYASGCMAGASALPADGAGWQVMRPSRNRAWGRQEAVDFIARLAQKGRAQGWPGLLIGDISQPRGGPMTSGHASHQIGLDIDIWLTPEPDHQLSRAERENIGAASVVAPGGLSVNSRWSAAHAGILQAAAEDPAVDRIFVNAAIKQALCASPAPWMSKIRPWWGHDAHFHVRLGCPAGEPACTPQAPPPPGPGCDASLAWWFTDEALHPVRGTPRAPATMEDLPAQCRAVLEAPDAK